MARRNNNRILVPGARARLDHFKTEISQEIGAFDRLGAGTTAQATSGQNWNQTLDKYKYEVASELGLLPTIQQVGWADMPTRDLGRIGGKIGGPIGGNMVKRMIEYAERNMPELN